MRRRSTVIRVFGSAAKNNVPGGVIPGAPIESLDVPEHQIHLNILRMSHPIGNEREIAGVCWRRFHS